MSDQELKQIMEGIESGDPLKDFCDEGETVAELVPHAIKLRDALRAANSIMWMAEKYAEAGGSGGPEMRDYKRAERLIAKAMKEASK